MFRRLRYSYTTCLLLLVVFLSSQNQNNKWYFGTNAGLDFMTVPPTPTTGALVTSEGCASIANAAGNLLFYTDGSTIWNQLGTIMGNGTGLGGNASTTQSSIIVRQPGSSTIYYVFSLQASNNANLKYAIVDMSLAAGLGSVTVNNILISTGNTERMTSVNHCNGTDVWVLVAPASNSINAYLVTSAGVNTVPVGSSVAGFNPSNSNSIGNLKVSPNGSKLALANYGSGIFNLCDFNNSTGVASNPVTLGQYNSSAYGVEFSPDGSKLYGTGGSNLYQWDLCAGSATAIAASIFSMSTTPPIGNAWGMQLATNGKIYMARANSTLSIINNPNLAGAAMNFTGNGLLLSSSAGLNLPNFITSGFLPPPPAFTYTVNNLFGCQTASFNAGAMAQPTLMGCAALGSSVTGIWWNFGDPASGAANTSTLTNPSHAFTALGTYTVKMLFNTSCGASTDTVKAQVIVNQPCISVTSQSITCASLGSATVTATGGIGPYSYTWMPTGQSAPTATNLSPGTYTITVYDAGNFFTYTATTTFVSLVPFAGQLSNTSNLPCFGASTGTAAVQLSGGSGQQSYSWISASATQTTPTASNLSAGVHTLLVMDAVTSCSVNQTFFINQPPQMVLNVTASSPTACIGGSISFTGQASGGIPGPAFSYTYNWLPSDPSNTLTVSKTLPGSYVYTLSATDASSCSVLTTVTASFIPKPFLSLLSVSICPNQTGTLTAGGASSYTWANNTTGNTFTDNPLSTTVYSVTGETAGCTSTISGQIILKTVPVPTLSSNSPVCNNQTLNLSASGGTAYAWNGPASFGSVLQNPQINPVQMTNNGIYNVTVTAANQCTAAASIGFTVNPTPTVLVRGDTVCTNQNAVLQSTASAATGFSWTGPLSFTSSLQNPPFTTPPVAASGFYTLVVTSAFGCTNSAIAGLTVSPLPTAYFTSDSPRCMGTQLNFNSSGSSGTPYYSWSGPNGFFSNLTNPGIGNVPLAASGVYTLTLTLGPCVTSFTNSVLINPLPVPVIQSNAPVCEGKTLQFSVNTFTAYQWSGPGTYTSSAQSNTLINTTLANSGSYSVTVTDINSCQAGTSMQFNVMPNPNLNMTNALVCYGTSAQLISTGANTYLWSGPNGYSATGGTAYIAQALNVYPATYTVMGTGLNTCTSVATAVLSTYTLPTPQAEITSRVCLNSAVSFSGTGGQTYQWSGPLGFHMPGQTFSLLANNPGMAGTYTLTVTDDKGCVGYTTAGFQIDSPPRGQLWLSNAQRCVPFCADLGLTLLGGDPPAVTNWSVNGIPVSGSNFNYCFYQAGVYHINGEFSSGISCRNAQSFVVETYPVPVADFNYVPDAPSEGDEVVFQSTSTGVAQKSWTWYFGTNLANSDSRDRVVYTFREAGTYPVAMVLKNQWGCADTVVKSLFVDEDFQVFVPNSFTPNQDNLNEVFTVVGRGIRNFTMNIYDRWGERVFFSDDPLKGWDGTLKGKDCQTGTYVWLIEVKSVKGKERSMKGTVTLYR